MADSANPISPKVIAGGIAGALLPALVYGLQLIADAVVGIEGLPSWVYTVAAIVGFVVAAYSKKDESRVNTVPQAESRLQDLVAKETDAEADPVLP